jgi:hypothetical protein
MQKRTLAQKGRGLRGAARPLIPPVQSGGQSLGEQILTVAQPAVGVVDDDAAGLHALGLLAARRLVGHAGRLGLVDGSAADERRLDPQSGLAAARRRRAAGPRRRQVLLVDVVHDGAGHLLDRRAHLGVVGHRRRGRRRHQRRRRWLDAQRRRRQRRLRGRRRQPLSGRSVVSRGVGQQLFLEMQAQLVKYSN